MTHYDKDEDASDQGGADDDDNDNDQGGDEDDDEDAYDQVGAGVKEGSAAKAAAASLPSCPARFHPCLS